MTHVASAICLMIAVGSASVAGCASSPPLRTDASNSGIRAAEEVGAASVPRAALHLQMAKEELQRAKGLALKGDKEEADSMLLRAESDAELAVALSRVDSERSEALAERDRVRELRRDNQ
jgi:hypothetical protein